MLWGPFVYNGVEYDLSHLHPFAFTVTVAAKDGKPEQAYRINVIFSFHCFTEGLPTEADCDPALVYRHDREVRSFCFERHKLSAVLPDVMRGIGSRKCFHTPHQSFFIVQVAELDGRTCDYAIFFKVSKATKGRKLNLFVQSAYRIEGPKNVGGAPLKRGKPIKFSVIAHNVCSGKSIKVPR